MDTWGISGPRFLLIYYVVLLGVATLLAVVARRRALAGPVQGAVVPSRLDPYEAAYLNGGEALVAPPPSPACSAAGSWPTPAAAAVGSGW